MLSRQTIYTNMCKLLLTDTRFHTDEIVLVMSCSSVQCWCSFQTFKHISGVNSYTCRIHINICNYISEGGVWGGRGWWAIGFHQGAGGWREALVGGGRCIQRAGGRIHIIIFDYNQRGESEGGEGGGQSGLIGGWRISQNSCFTCMGAHSGSISRAC